MVHPVLDHDDLEAVNVQSYRFQGFHAQRGSELLRDDHVPILPKVEGSDQVIMFGRSPPHWPSLDPVRGAQPLNLTGECDRFTGDRVNPSADSHRDSVSDVVLLV